MIRLVTVIGHGVDLLPHFIKHYQQYVDEIHIGVYETELHPLLGNQVKEIVENYNNVKIVKILNDRVFDWNKVTQLYNFIKNSHQHDWWVVADIDEFHLYPNDDLRKMVTNCNEYGWDIVRGGFIDRVGIDGTFPAIVEDKNIFEQFPAMGFFRYPMSKANPNKVCVMKGYVELTSGQHYVKLDGHTTWKWQGWNHPLINPHSFVQVHHFKWDKTCVDRIKQVVLVNQDYSYSDEYKIMFDSLRKSRFKIDVTNNDFMFENSDGYPEFKRYKQWNKLINKIISI
jgi:hypothetical protein